MHPREYFDNFWRPELREEAFVAMSFDSSMEPVWRQIIEPAINAVNLRACRVDSTHICGDILTQIMEGIAHARLVLGELTGLLSHRHGSDERNPSANVMYEIGLTHALRQEVEVVLIAANGSRIPFDISAARVHFYSPTTPGIASEQLTHWLKGALAEVDLRKHLKVEVATQALDRGCLRFLRCYAAEEQFPTRTFQENARQITESLPMAAQASMIEAERRGFEAREGPWYEWDKGHAVIHRLFDLGIVTSVVDSQRENRFLAWTPFGVAVLRKLGLRT